MAKIYLPSNRSPRPTEQRFRILQPWATNYGPVSCKDYDCEQYLAGYGLPLAADNENVEQMRHWLKHGFPDGIRRYAKETVDPAGLVVFTFPAGQPCLKQSQHRWHIRPPLFAHERNEMRQNLSFPDFTDSMNNESYKIAHEREKG